MTDTPISELIPVIEVAVAPVILISGVGLLLLTMTNRFGRAIDRARLLSRELRTHTDPDQKRLEAQVRILYRRARLIQVAVISAACSVLLVAILIIALFVTTLLHLQATLLVSLLFMGTMVSLIVSLCAFIREVQLSLMALKLEVGEVTRD